MSWTAAADLADEWADLADAEIAKRAPVPIAVMAGLEHVIGAMHPDAVAAWKAALIGKAVRGLADTFRCRAVDDDPTNPEGEAL